MSKKNEGAQLREALFSQMQRLSDPNANLDLELKRADAIAKVGTVIVNSHKQEVDYMKLLGRKQPGKTASLTSVAGKKQLGNG